MYPEHGRDLFEVFEKSEASFSDYSVTIGVTSYNCKNTIRDCIDSALSQAYPVQEILIIDDHSLDGTRDILLQLAHNTDCITVIFNKQNAGVSAARNQIIQLAKTEFIAFFDKTIVPEAIAVRFVTDLFEISIILTLPNLSI